jgi:hypothetical protein
MEAKRTKTADTHDLQFPVTFRTREELGEWLRDHWQACCDLLQQLRQASAPAPTGCAIGDKLLAAKRTRAMAAELQRCAASSGPPAFYIGKVWEVAVFEALQTRIRGNWILTYVHGPGMEIKATLETATGRLCVGIDTKNYKATVPTQEITKLRKDVAEEKLAAAAMIATGPITHQVSESNPINTSDNGTILFVCSSNLEFIVSAAAVFLQMIAARHQGQSGHSRRLERILQQAVTMSDTLKEQEKLHRRNVCAIQEILALADPTSFC